MRHRWARAKKRLIAEIFPASCGLCGFPLDDGTICAGCRADLPWIRCCCARCAVPLAARSDAPCAACQSDEPPFARAYAPLHYAFPVDAVIKALKFRHRLSVAPMLADLCVPWLHRHRDEFDGLIPVPLNRWRHAVRGFNQSDEIARRLRRATGLAVDRCVRRVRRTRPQTGLDATERRRNLRDAFAVVRKPHRRVLVVDDVMTTGATTRELCATLLEAGVEEVSVLAIARASG